MELSEVMQIINQVGFPVAVCAYFALRFEKILQANTAALRELRDCFLKKGVTVDGESSI